MRTVGFADATEYMISDFYYEVKKTATPRWLSDDVER